MPIAIQSNDRHAHPERFAGGGVTGPRKRVERDVDGMVHGEITRACRSGMAEVNSLGSNPPAGPLLQEVFTHTPGQFVADTSAAS